MTKIIDDDQILQLLLSGNTYEKGFRYLVTKYQERLYWHIRRIVITHEDADDVIQNTFIKVFRNINQFKGNSKLYTWLYRIASNEALTHLNKNKKKKTIGLEEELINIGNNLKADIYFDGDEAQIKLQQAIYTLPNKQKQVFHLRYYDEMNYNDMSNMLGTSVGALKASYHLAVKKIESFLVPI